MTAQKTAQKNTDVQISSDIVRAFAEALDHGYVGSLQDFASSEDGQTAARAIQDQKNAEMRSLRMAWARAVAKDFKVNGKLTAYSKDRAMKLRDYLATVDFDAIQASESEPGTPEPGTDDAE